jgi:hypothetical protein
MKRDVLFVALCMSYVHPRELQQRYKRVSRASLRFTLSEPEPGPVADRLSEYPVRVERQPREDRAEIPAERLGRAWFLSAVLRAPGLPGIED